MNKYDIKPVLKWAGGKRQLIEEINKCLPTTYKRYFEPFIGGGALLFELQPERAIINDYNWELTNLYHVIKNNPDELIERLTIYQEKHSKEFYYEIRELDRKNEFESMSDVEKAARTLYLNRTCYNGLFRVNRSGYFNTPMGRYRNPQILNSHNIRELSQFFNFAKVDITTGDFAEILKRTRKGDFVYLDPPYFPLTETSSFTDYTELGFGKIDQLRLKEECEKLHKKGVFFLQSNSDCPFIRDLYGEFYIKTVVVRRSINSEKSKRANMTEVLIANYPIN